MNKTKLKYKFLSYEELIINLDRLSRFKLPEITYNRVFNSIIYKCLISPQYSKTDIEKLDSEQVSKIVETIWNNSIQNLYGKQKKNKKFNLLKFLTEYSFKNTDLRTKKLINTNLIIEPLVKNLDYDSIQINLKFLYKNIDAKNKSDIINISETNGLLFPIKKLVIVEGITEEILLPVFANKLKHNFFNERIFIYSAGGKSKSPSLYMELKNKVKIPIILLFDADAYEICKTLEKNLLKKDNIIIIQNGEFEDILSKNLIKRSLNNEYKPATPAVIEDLKIYEKMCENIEYFYRTRHLGEFKKAKFSKIIATNIKYKTDITQEIKNVISNII